MPTAPEKVRRALTVVTAAAIAEARAVAAQAPREPQGWRAALFATAPLIVSEYGSGAATLGTDWFEEIRDSAPRRHRFTPRPLVSVTDDDVAAMVARTTAPLHDLEIGKRLEADFETLVAQSLAELEADMQRQVASGFWDTMTTNALEDPDASGWRRYARAGACKFCLMLADKGAVFSEESARFAAHTNCHCVVGPAYDPHAEKADVWQYMAARRKRTAKQKADLRAYLNDNFPDAPG